MSKNAWTDYDATAASNTDIGGVDAQGTAPASNMNDLIQELASHTADVMNGTAPVKDTMTFADPVDLTKRVRIDAGNVTAGQTRVLSMPDANVTIPSGTLVTETGTQTLTNKTLTTPTISSPSITTSATITRTDDGASGASLTLTHVSASPAASDNIANISATGRDSAGNAETYGLIQHFIDDPTSGSEDSRWAFATEAAGTLAVRGNIGAGLYMTGATGGDPGAGKINASEVQENGVALGYKLTTGTSQATTSGTAFDFSSIPSWVKRITVMFSEVSLSGTDSLLVQIGDSGGLETTGYVSESATIQGGSTGSDLSTTGFVLRTNAAARAISGMMVIQHMGSNRWVSSHSAGAQNSGSIAVGGGGKALSDTLDRLRLTRTGSDTFDGGSVNIMYE